MRKIDVACIVDDDPIYIFATRKIMKMAGFCNSFLVFHNGKEALDNLQAIIKSGSQVPDIILLDLNMPIMDGWQFLDEFVKVQHDKVITIYIVTSSIDPDDIKRAKSYEMVNNYVIKPVTEKKLQEILHDFQAS